MTRPAFHVPLRRWLRRGLDARASRLVLGWAWLFAIAGSLAGATLGSYSLQLSIAGCAIGGAVAAWTVAGMLAWALGASALWQQVARLWAQAHLAAFVVIDVTSLVFAGDLHLVSARWPPLAAGAGGLGAMYLVGLVVIVP